MIVLAEGMEIAPSKVYERRYAARFRGYSHFFLCQDWIPDILFASVTGFELSIFDGY